MHITGYANDERRIKALCDAVMSLDFQVHALTLEVQMMAGDGRYSDEEFVTATEQTMWIIRGLDLSTDRVMRKIKAMRRRSPDNIVLRPLPKESEVKAELKRYMREMYGEDPLGEQLCRGVDNIPEEEAEKILGDLQEYERRMPETLAMVDALIRECKAGIC